MTVLCDFYVSFASNALKMSALKYEFLSFLHCWWEFKFPHPLWKTEWRFLRKLKIELTYDPAVPLLGIHLDKIAIQKDTCGNSLVVQWLGLCALTAKGLGLIRVRELSSHKPCGMAKKYIYTCTPMFITALFTIIKTWKQPKCPSADEQIKKIWYMGLPWWSSDWDSNLPMQGAQVLSLVKELDPTCCNEEFSVPLKMPCTAKNKDLVCNN